MPNIQKNVSLKPYNTFGLDHSARLFVEIVSLAQLQELISLPEFQQNETLILGGGSNILLTKDFDGLVIKNNIRGIEITEEQADWLHIKVGAGEIWHEFVSYCVARNYGGIENLSLIPGTVGAAPMQNIGAYGVEIKEVFEELEALHIDTNTIERFDKEACRFGYRESVFKQEKKGQYVIVNATFRLSKKPQLHLEYGAIKETLTKMKVQNPGIQEVSRAVIEIRQSKLPDPKQIGNSGSFFKNPVVEKGLFEKIKVEYPAIPAYPVENMASVKIPAGWLIEQAGWKGKTFGAIGVHKDQALVLVNYGGGKGADLVQLSKEIQQSVFEKFGVTLRPEVNII